MTSDASRGLRATRGTGSPPAVRGPIRRSSLVARRWSDLHPRVQRVAQAVAEEIEGENGDGDEHAGRDADVRVGADVGAPGREDRAPGGLRRLRAEAEEAQRRLGQD